MGDFTFKKKYGQNFIKNKNIVERMVLESDILEDTLVIEVGPGMGVLTEELSLYAKNVLCYEIDTTLKPYLDKKFVHSNVEIIYEDFLGRDILMDIKKYKYKYLYFIANVPYYITTPILMKIMEMQSSVSKIVMMVQKEVGERLCALCGSRNYSSISVYLDYFYERCALFLVPRYEFVPVPNVDSIIVSFTRRDFLLEVKDYSLFFRIVRDSFQFKRKTIKNNLKSYDLTKVEKVLLEHGYTLSSRAEALSLEVFVAISNSLL